MNKENNNLLIIDILKKSVDKISSYLKLDAEEFNGILKNTVFKENSSGHNNKIFLVDFFDNKNSCLGNVCIKYSSDKKKQAAIITEANILQLLYLKKKDICPKFLDINIIEQKNTAYLIMENIKGNSITNLRLGIETAQEVLDLILFHEPILLNNIKQLNSLSLIENMYKKIDFRKKISKLLINFVPNFTVKSSLNFLNHYLNSEFAIKRRTIITDRSVDNILKNKNNSVTFIDFSTIRVGTLFDNWVQFIDDPRAIFSCKKEDLIQIFFKRNNLGRKDLKFFYTASVYTNLLQGIFTYTKNPKLGVSYFENANNSFMKLKNKKGMLININHQHALQQS